jgi:hypothetical protein
MSKYFNPLSVVVYFETSTPSSAKENCGRVRRTDAVVIDAEVRSTFTVSIDFTRIEVGAFAVILGTINADTEESMANRTNDFLIC